MYTQANYYAVLPAAVRYDAKLTARAKLLYATLTSLSIASGAAFPSNKYIAELYGVDERTAKRLVGELEAQKYIAVSYEYKKGTKEILRRLIRLNGIPLLLDLANTQALYAVIPSWILSTDLSVQAKLLYAEISAATPDNGFCSKNAAYFAELLGVSETSVQRWTRELVAADALRIEVEYKGDSREIRRRRIYLTEAAAIIEKRRQIASDGLNDGASNSGANNANEPNKPNSDHILGGDIFDTTSYAAESGKRFTARRKPKRGKRRKNTQKLRL